MKRYLAIAACTTLLTVLPLVFVAAQLPRITEQQQKAYEDRRAHLYKWEPWQFLIGTWEGEAAGTAGIGVGKFTFRPDLDGKVLVTTNIQPFGATKDQPSFTYRGLMVVYLEGLDTRAIFFDNEGHVLHYKTQLSEAQKRVTFISDVVPMAPRFRFSYAAKDSKTLDVLFETAPANAPREYSVKVRGVARRVSD